MPYAAGQPAWRAHRGGPAEGGSSLIGWKDRGWRPLPTTQLRCTPFAIPRSNACVFTAVDQNRPATAPAGTDGSRNVADRARVIGRLHAGGSPVHATSGASATKRAHRKPRSPLHVERAPLSKDGSRPARSPGRRRAAQGGRSPQLLHSTHSHPLLFTRSTRAPALPRRSAP